MAEFKPTTLPSSNTGAVNFVQSGAGAATDFSQQLALAAKVGERVHGKIVAEDAFERIENVQNSFLANRNEITAAESELSLLRDQNPSEAAVADKAEKRIKELQNFARTGGISPTRATSQVEAIRREAMAKAPIFKKEIQGFAGSRGASFDVETEQLIKERNDVRDRIVSWGGNPDNPKDIELDNRNQKLAFNNNLRTQEVIRDSRNAEDLLSGQLSQIAFPIEMQIQKAIESVNGDVTQLDPQLLTNLQASLLQQSNTATETINQMIVRNGFKISDINVETRERLAQDLINETEHYTGVLNGSIAATTGSNQLLTGNNKVVLDLRRDNPGAYNLMVLANKVGTESVAGMALSERLQNKVLDYYEIMANEGPSSDFLSQKFRIETAKDSKALQDSIANTLKVSRNFFTSAKNPDPITLQAHGVSLVNLSKNMLDDPRAFSQGMVGELMDSANSKTFLNHFNKAGDSTATIYASNMSAALQSYSRQRTVPDIKKDISEATVRNTRSIFDRGVGTSVVGEEYIRPVLSSDGTIRFDFIDSDKFDDSSRAKAKRNIIAMNKRYANFTSRIVQTSANLSGAGQSSTNKRDQAVFLFGSLFPNEITSKEDK